MKNRQTINRYAKIGLPLLFALILTLPSFSKAEGLMLSRERKLTEQSDQLGPAHWSIVAAQSKPELEVSFRVPSSLLPGVGNPSISFNNQATGFVQEGQNPTYWPNPQAFLTTELMLAADGNSYIFNCKIPLKDDLAPEKVKENEQIMVAGTLKGSTGQPIPFSGTYDLNVLKAYLDLTSNNDVRPTSVYATPEGVFVSVSGEGIGGPVTLELVSAAGSTLNSKVVQIPFTKAISETNPSPVPATPVLVGFTESKDHTPLPAGSQVYFRFTVGSKIRSYPETASNYITILSREKPKLTLDNQILPVGDGTTYTVDLSSQVPLKNQVDILSYTVSQEAVQNKENIAKSDTLDPSQKSEDELKAYKIEIGSRLAPDKRYHIQFSGIKKYGLPDMYKDHWITVVPDFRCTSEFFLGKADLVKSVNVSFSQTGILISADTSQSKALIQLNEVSSDGAVTLLQVSPAVPNPTMDLKNFVNLSKLITTTGGSTNTASSLLLHLLIKSQEEGDTRTYSQDLKLTFDLAGLNQADLTKVKVAAQSVAAVASSQQTLSVTNQMKSTTKSVASSLASTFLPWVLSLFK